MNKIGLMFGLSALALCSLPTIASASSTNAYCPTISSQDLASLARKGSVLVGGMQLLPLDEHAALNIKVAASGVGKKSFEPIHAVPQIEDHRYGCKYMIDSNGVKEVWMWVRSEDEWARFHDAFADAFHRGDIEKLNELKESGAKIGFGNINDLSGEFVKYGSGLSQWDALIADAAKKKK